MAVKITEEIVGFKVSKKNISNDDSVKNVDEPEAIVDVDVPEKESNVVQMHERVKRPNMLLGSTYKIKIPLSEHALYVTVNDIVLNPDSEYELRRPFEIFINSKNMEHFQWIVALTRILSAVFRKGGDITFLVAELRSVFAPSGGYFKNGKFMPSLVAEIGDVLESHLRMIGMLKDDAGLNKQQKDLLTEKRAAYGQMSQNVANDDVENNFPVHAKLCHQCHAKSMVQMDGCMTCLSCGESKCG